MTRADVMLDPMLGDLTVDALALDRGAGWRDLGAEGAPERGVVVGELLDLPDGVRPRGVAVVDSAGRRAGGRPPRSYALSAQLRATSNDIVILPSLSILLISLSVSPFTLSRRSLVLSPMT